VSPRGSNTGGSILDGKGGSGLRELNSATFRALNQSGLGSGPQTTSVGTPGIATLAQPDKASTEAEAATVGVEVGAGATAVLGGNGAITEAEAGTKTGTTPDAFVPRGAGVNGVAALTVAEDAEGASAGSVTRINCDSARRARHSHPSHLSEMLGT
jgi:hypothetical protein